jgi:hypothetical protein
MLTVSTARDCSPQEERRYKICLGAADANTEATISALKLRQTALLANICPGTGLVSKLTALQA